MNPAPVFDRVYAGLKELLREGGMAPGTHLDPAQLAGKLVASITPVRDALHRLAGERLVDTGSDGFAVLTMSEPDLRDLYDWNLQLLRLALQSSLSSQFHYQPSGNGAAADRIERFFTAIGAHSSNREHGIAIEGINDRLRRIRELESEVLPDIQEEFDAVVRADLRTLRTLIGTYHRRRLSSVPLLVRALYRRVG